MFKMDLKMSLMLLYDIDTPDQIFMVAEKTIISVIKTPSDIYMDCCHLSLSLIYMYYPHGYTDMYTFCETVILALICKVPVSVSHFLPSFQSHT